MWLEPVSFENRLIEGERLELSAKGALYYLGPNVTFRDCTLILRVPTRRLLVPGARFLNCTIEVKQELRNLRWDEAFFTNCSFTGKLTGCDFGGWPEAPEKGGIEGCDFSAAHLDGCRFLGCDASTLRFPTWPCFTLLDPVQRSRELASVRWPGEVGLVLGDFRWDPPSTVAVTYSATELAKRYGIREEALRAVLQRLDGVKY